MSVDVILLSTPNKNIDYPGLALPALTAALREEGISVQQLDVNMTLRHQLLSADSLAALLETTIPEFACILQYSEQDLHRLLALKQYLQEVRTQFGFSVVEQVKKRAQARDYSWIFEDSSRFEALLALFKLNRALHYLIDLAIQLVDVPAEDILTQQIRDTLDAIASVIEMNQPEVIGLSILDIQRAFSKLLLSHLRGQFSGKIVVGGADPTRFCDAYAEHWTEVDAVFYREADRSLPQYIAALGDRAGSLEKIGGVVYRDKSGAVARTRPRPVDLDEIPCPDFRGLPLDLYLTPALPIQSSRGCYWQKCRFCIHWDTYFDFRAREPVRVVDDIRALVRKHGTHFFHFTDDCLPVAYAERLATEINHTSLDIRWLAYFRLEGNLSRSTLEKVSKAGGRVLEMGLESASTGVLRAMKKRISVTDAERIVEDATELGMLPKLFMFHGFPGESLEDVEKTIAFTERQIRKGTIRPFLALRNRFELLLGSDVYKCAVLGTEEDIARRWLPSGLFSVRAEYERRTDEAPIRTAVEEFVNRVREYMITNRVFDTDDENVVLDLLVLDAAPLAAGWGCLR